MMLVPTIVMGVIAVILVAIGYSKGGGQHITGIKSAGEMLTQILPLLLFALRARFSFRLLPA